MSAVQNSISSSVANARAPHRPAVTLALQPSEAASGSMGALPVRADPLRPTPTPSALAVLRMPSPAARRSLMASSTSALTFGPSQLHAPRPPPGEPWVDAGEDHVAFDLGERDRLLVQIEIPGRHPERTQRVDQNPPAIGRGGPWPRPSRRCAAARGILEQRVEPRPLAASLGAADAAVIIRGDDGPARLCSDGFKPGAGFRSSVRRC